MKKRVEYLATSFELIRSDVGSIVRFSGKEDVVLELFREDSSVFAKLLPCDDRLTLRGASLIGQLDWLFLDFQQFDYLHRIAVSAQFLNHTELARAMRILTDGADSGFGHIQVKEVR